MGSIENEFRNWAQWSHAFLCGYEFDSGFTIFWSSLNKGKCNVDKWIAFSYRSIALSRAALSSLMPSTIAHDPWLCQGCAFFRPSHCPGEDFEGFLKLRFSRRLKHKWHTLSLRDMQILRWNILQHAIAHIDTLRVSCTVRRNLSVRFQ